MAVTPPDPRLIDSLPKKVSEFRVLVSSYNGNVYDITPQITEVSMYESIYSPFIYGEVIIVDNSAMLSTLPFIGQETIAIGYRRDGEKMEREFRVTDVYDIVPAMENVGTYGLSFTSDKQLRNSVSLFSKAYSGLASDIISDIHSEFLREEIDVLTPAKEEHSVVFPYMKPYQAIDMITRNVLAKDSTPLFLYEALYEERVRLQSFGDMFDQEPIMDLKPTHTANTDFEQGLQSKDTYRNRGQIFDHAITKGYNTLEKLSNGTYGASVLSIDQSKKKALVSDFDYFRHAPSQANEYISEFFQVNDRLVNSNYDTKKIVIPQNETAFDSGLSNLNGTTELDKTILNSYRKRIQSTVNVSLYMDSIHIPQDTEQKFSVGKTVNYIFPRFSPKLSEHEDNNDKVNSGKYIISSIRHYLKNGEYTMSVELIRDGMGADADLLPNGDASDLTVGPRNRVSILGTF